MKALFLLTLSLLAMPAMAVQISKLNCVPGVGGSERAQVTVVFARSIDPLKPIIGWYSMGATLQVLSPQSGRIYNRTDLRMTAIDSLTDVNIRGDAGNCVYLRLYPEIINAQATGHYTGQLFVNDLQAKAYYNFSDDQGQPGLICQGQ